MPGPKKGAKYKRRAGPFGLNCLRLKDEELAGLLKQRTEDERASFLIWVVRALGREDAGEKLRDLKIEPDEPWQRGHYS